MSKGTASMGRKSGKKSHIMCRRCGKRFSVRSVWAASQLPAALKHRLVEMFALGVPVYRQRFRQDTSPAARERFYRILRACCAHAEEQRSLRSPVA